MPHFPNWRPVFGWQFAVIDNPPRTSFVNKCRDTPREPPGSGIIGSFRSRAISASVGIAKLLSRVVLAICPPTGNLREFLFLHILGNVWCYQTHQCLWIGGRERCVIMSLFAFPWWPLWTVGFPRLWIAYSCALSIFLSGHLASSDVCVDGVVPIKMQLKHSFVLLKNVSQFWFSHWHL